MKGIRISNYNNGSSIQSRFNNYFNTVIDKSNSDIWIMSQDSIWLSIDDIDEQDNIDSKKLYEAKDYYIVDSNFMKQYAKYVNNSWNALMCLSLTLDEAKKYIKDVESIKGNYGDIISYALYTREVGYKYMFSNYDGAFWDCISENEQELERLKDELINTQGIQVEDLTQEEINQFYLSHLSEN